MFATIGSGVGYAIEFDLLIGPESPAGECTEDLMPSDGEDTKGPPSPNATWLAFLRLYSCRPPQIQPRAAGVCWSAAVRNMLNSSRSVRSSRFRKLF